jgi:hypothetical protein
VHDFLIPELGRAVRHGVYDIASNAGWVSVGIDHDTASFAVNAIRRWWQSIGCARYPQAHRLLITADCGGSNGARVGLWKHELQALANELGLSITVCHLPPVPASGTGSSIVCSHSSRRPGDRAADWRNHHPHRPEDPVCHR